MSALRPGLSRLTASTAQQTSRQLHITGQATFPTPLVNSSRPTPKGLPRDVAALRAECRSKNLPTDGGKAELTARVTAARSLPAALFGPPNTSPATSTRNFNSSRDLKAVNDSSTIDFAFIPDFDPDAASNPAPPRVPVVTQQQRTGGVAASQQIDETLAYFARQTIHTANAAAGRVLPFSDLLTPADGREEGEAANVDLATMAARVAAAAKRRLGGNLDAASDDSMAEAVRTVWSGFLDDVLGPEEEAKKMTKT